MPRIFAFITHKGGVVDDSAAELFAATKKIDVAAAPTAIVTGWGAELDDACDHLCASFPEVWEIGSEALAYPNAELTRQALVKVLPAGSIVVLAHEHFGIDLAPGLSIKLNAAFASDLLAIDGREGDRLKVVRQEFGGQVSAHVQCDISSGAVLTIRPGAFKPVAISTANGVVVDRSGEMGTAAVSCSRPVVDAKWLEKSRQVGSSGKTVKPKVYLACGISGAFQHMAGLKGNPFIIAINKNPKAPIFQVADVGIVDDLLELLPELTNKIREMRKAA
jgi:electron transfer flavoprotein alpha subunit